MGPAAAFVGRWPITAVTTSEMLKLLRRIESNVCNCVRAAGNDSRSTDHAQPRSQLAQFVRRFITTDFCRDVMRHAKRKQR